MAALRCWISSEKENGFQLSPFSYLLQLFLVQVCIQDVVGDLLEGVWLGTGVAAACFDTISPV